MHREIRYPFDFKHFNLTKYF